MKLNKIMLATTVIFGLSAAANADQGHGKVTFNGAIIDAPCSIAPESIDQTIELGQISKVALKDGGKSTPRNFSINLENCSLEDGKNKVSVIFSGMTSVADNGLLGITGTAKGASIAITDGSGAVIELGKSNKDQVIQSGNNTLSFSAYVQGDGALETITEGEFQAVTDFTLAYN